MRTKRSLARGLLIALAISLIPDPAISAQKVNPGSKCKVQKQKVNYLDKTYTCIKSGKRLVWNKGVVIIESPFTVKPLPVPADIPVPASILYNPPTEPGDSVELCKLNEASKARGYTWAGFPEQKPLTPKTGTVKWALIPIDFTDLPGEKNFRSRVDDQMKLLSEWFESVSEGKFKVEWVIADRWTTLPGNTSDYPVTKTTGVNNTPGGVKLFRAAMSAADLHFDFSNVQTVNFILPLNQNIASEGEQGFPWDQHVKDFVTQEGSISSFTIPGKYQTWPDHPFWSYWVHEFGHGIGLPHVGGNGPAPSPFNPWDIMGGQDGPSKELSGWIRFLSRWMSDERIYCKDASKVIKSEITLVPLSNNDPGVKVAMFPISATKALIIESRRETKFSCINPTPRNGILVYALDLSLGHGQDFLVPISPLGREKEERATCNGTLSMNSTNLLLLEGDKVSFGGLSVEVLKVSNFDRIVVSR
jgi:M6 family metalloprotease-like protein